VFPDPVNGVKMALALMVAVTVVVGVLVVCAIGYIINRANHP
jgi:hypothetical protein